MRTLYSLSFVLLILSCSSKKSNPDQTTNPVSKTENYSPMDNQSLDDQMNDLKNTMIEYRNAAQPSYTEGDINACLDILNQYRIQMVKSNSKEEGMKAVKTAVLKLNELNEKCGLELIETEERERIAEIIITAGSQKGYNTIREDITEPWREW